MENNQSKIKKIEKEKLVAETLNGRFAMLGLIAALGAYLTTGQIIPGFIKKNFNWFKSILLIHVIRINLHCFVFRYC